MEWNCEYAIRGLPDKIRERFMNRAGFLHRDLDVNRYEGAIVELPYTTTHDGQKGRITVSENPHWYSEFYWDNTPHEVVEYSNKTKRRRLKKTIDRGCVLRALGYIANSSDRDNFRYHSLMRETVLDCLLSGVPIIRSKENYDSLIEQVSLELLTEPDNEVRLFFGMEKIETYRDELLGLQKKHGKNEGEEIFYRQFMGGGASSVYDDEIPF